MEDANGVDLQQFRHWYSQSGTPELHISGSHDPLSKTYSLTVQQSCPDTAGQKGFGVEEVKGVDGEKQKAPVEIQNSSQNAHHALQKQPFHIPLALGLLDQDGNALPLKLSDGSADNFSDTIILELRKQTETFVFEDVSAAPVPSLLRGFSAPVKLHFDYSNADLVFFTGQ